MIRCENQTVKVTDGLLTIPIHIIHAYSNGVMFCSISDPEKLNNVLIDVPSMRYLSTDPDQPVYIQEKRWSAHPSYGPDSLHIQIKRRLS